jgi:4-amino-4-deoxy-L-arabinose transferase-like glycosyltransferase
MLDSETVETVSSAQQNPTMSKAARVGWAVLIVATLYVCYFSHLGAIGFVGPDEPRYAWIARDMSETGDWVTPRLYGKPWFEKPPLIYWGAALSFKLFGVSEAAARLPSAISALLATLAVAWLALRLYGAETARWLLLLLPTTVGMIGFSHAAATDMPFSAMLTIAMVCAAVVLGLTRNENSPIIPQTPWLALILFGFFLGLAVLAKGPAAIILSGGAVFFWAVLTKRWRDAFRLLHPAAIVAFCVTALPWYILCARRNPDFFRIFIIEHNFKRYLTPEFQHIQPFWFYLPVLLVAFLPWTALLFWTAIEGGARIAESKRISPHTLFLLTWFLFVVLFFSLSRSKLPGYILPSIPPICLLLTHACVAMASVYRKSFRVIVLTAAVILFLLFALVRDLTPHISRTNEKFGVIAGWSLFLMGAANLFLAIFYPARSSTGIRNVFAASSVVPILLVVSLVDVLLTSYFHWDPSGRTLSEELRRSGIPSRGLLVRSMSRGQRYSLSYYLHDEVADWEVEHPKEGYVLLEGRYCRELMGPGLTCREIPFNLEKTGFFLYRIELQSSDGLSRSGEAEQEK